MQFNIEEERKQLVIYKNDKQIHLCLNDSENLIKWAEALLNLGIPEKGSDDLPFGNLDTANTIPLGAVPNSNSDSQLSQEQVHYANNTRR